MYMYVGCLLFVFSVLGTCIKVFLRLGKWYHITTGYRKLGNFRGENILWVIFCVKFLLNQAELCGTTMEEFA